MLMFFRRYAPLITLGLLAACSTNSGPTNLETAAEFSNASGKALLVMDMTGNFICNRSNLTLTEKNGETVTIPLKVRKKSNPTVKVVNPGSYKISYGTCVNGGIPRPLPDIPIWFGTIDLKAGQTIYAGTVYVEKHELKTRREGLDAVNGFLSLDTNKETNFITYEIENQLETVKEKLGPELASMTNELIYSPPLAILDEAEFETALQRAYEKTAEGKNPSQSEVDKRIKTEIRTALTRSLATVQDRNPDYKGPIGN